MRALGPEDLVAPHCQIRAGAACSPAAHPFSRRHYFWGRGVGWGGSSLKGQSALNGCGTCLPLPAE